MAGIGWKLQKMIDRGSLAGTMGAYLTGVAVTSAPWLLTTSVLMSVRLLARGDGAGLASFVLVERMTTLIYALTVILSAPVHVVVSRYTADRLFDKHLEKIPAPLWRATRATVLGFLGVGAALMIAMRPPLLLGVVGTLLTVVVGAQWLMLSVGGGLCSPVVVLRAFCTGAPLGVGASLLLCRALGLGALGYLVGFTAGQLTTLILILRGVAGAIPRRGDESARLWPAFLEYRLLAISSLVYYVSIWTDKAMVWLLAGPGAASQHSSVAAIAWFSVIPAFSWIYVEIETVFYRRFRAFYQALGSGAPVSALRTEAALVTNEARRILLGAVRVQASMLVVAVVAAPVLMHVASLPRSCVYPFRLAVTGASLQLISLLELLLLYYFDLREEALVVSLTLFVGEVVLVSACWVLRVSPTAGYALACGLAAVVGFLLVRARLATLLIDTFQQQPFGDSL
jgi:uncharacterized membrane protein